MTERERDLRVRLSDFYAPHEIDLWLSRPHKLLGGQSAQQLIDAGRIDEVERVLGQLDSGARL
jgi:hypothetical protein